MSFETSLFSDVSQKTYTMTWSEYGKFFVKDWTVCRERIWPLCSRFTRFATAVEFYLYLCDERASSSAPCRFFRLIKAGKLVARSATYQGV